MKHLVCDDGTIHSMSDASYTVNTQAPCMIMFRDYMRDQTLKVGQKWIVRMFPNNPDMLDLSYITIEVLTDKTIVFTVMGDKWCHTREFSTIKFIEKVRK